MREVITSKSNQKIKNVRKLIESSKERKATGLFVVEGLRIFDEIPQELAESVFICESMSGQMELPDYWGLEIVADDIFKSLCDTVNPQGVLAVVRQPELSMDKVLEHSDLYVVLDDIRDPGNLGTIIRTAEAAGATVIMSPGCADVFNPKVSRSTMGSIFRVRMAICDTVEAITKLQKAGVRVFAAALDGSVPYDEADYGKSGRAFVIGNEANGVSKEAQMAADGCVRIPMKGQVESLNAAISAAVLMYYKK